jgi:hypothetical protein
MKDLIEEGKLILVYVPTDELVADILTKPMLGRKFQYLLFKLIGWSQTMVDDNYIDKSLSCRGGVLEYEHRLDEDAEGPVERTTGPVCYLNVPKIPVSDVCVCERERVREECA